MSIKLPSIREAEFGNENKDILDSIKLILDTKEGLHGGVEDRGITGQDLIELGLATKADLEKMLRGR